MKRFYNLIYLLLKPSITLIIIIINIFFLLFVINKTLAQNQNTKQKLPSRISENKNFKKSSQIQPMVSNKELLGTNQNISIIDNQEILAKNTDNWIFEIYRCPECGFEQDEPGFCPDHNNIKLVKVDKVEQLLNQPPELDGYEDIIVDIPLETVKQVKEDDKFSEYQE